MLFVYKLCRGAEAEEDVTEHVDHVERPLPSLPNDLELRELDPMKTDEEGGRHYCQVGVCEPGHHTVRTEEL